MAHPKRGTPACDRASAKWKETMTRRHGGEENLRAWLRGLGKQGGLKSRGGGFASMMVGKDGLTGRERAAVAGAKGGKISRRTGVKTGFGKVHMRGVADVEKALEALKDSQDGGD